MLYDKYWQLEGQVTTLYNQSNNIGALNLLEGAEKCLCKDEFNKHLFEIMMTKADFYSALKMYDKSIKVISDLIISGLPCDNDIFDGEGIKSHPRYDELKAKNYILLEKAKRDAKFKYEVHMPKDYIKGKKYGLFIGLHGDPGNIEEFSEYWKPDEFLRHNLICVYVQASQLYHHNGFCWNLDPLISRNEIKECYSILKKQYSIDEKCVIIGGFSGGAIASLDITFADVIPIKGFICLGPDISRAFTRDNVKLAVSRNVKGVFMEGEVLVPEPSQEKMIKIFDEVELKYEFYINKEIGHAVPKDLQDKLNKALNFICNI